MKTQDKQIKSISSLNIKAWLLERATEYSKGLFQLYFYFHAFI